MNSAKERSSRNASTRERTSDAVSPGADEQGVVLLRCAVHLQPRANERELPPIDIGSLNGYDSARRLATILSR